MKKKYQCPACHGDGGYVEPVLDYGEGPWYDCGFCKGKGEMTRRQFYKILWMVNRKAAPVQTPNNGSTPLKNIGGGTKVCDRCGRLPGGCMCRLVV